MSQRLQQPDYDAVLNPLKDFQKRTVEYVFHQLYKNPQNKGRFLVADEVGLGKTLVARGVIAKSIKHLWETTERIDVLYICSNADIAKQNINRLTIPGLNHFTPARRMTLLPISANQKNRRNFKDEKVNFVPLTPDTSFRMFSRFGTVTERALLFKMLQQAYEFPFTDGAMHVFSGDANKVRFRRDHLSNFDTWYTIDSSLMKAFLFELSKDAYKDLRHSLFNLCQTFQRSSKQIRSEHRNLHRSIISDLRSLLAKTCLDALEPDLVIMDEFQRFKFLLEKNNPAGELAQAVFDFPDVRTLLLSATPYKMYTLKDEEEGENHHNDFLETLKFLFDDPSIESSFKTLLMSYRDALLSFGNQNESIDRDSLFAIKNQIESQLKQVIARTEKLTASVDRNGMFKDVPTPLTSLFPKDLTAYVGLQRISEDLDHPNTLEYWKSAPYLLNFMEKYQLKKKFDNALTLENKAKSLASQLTQTPQLLLSKREIEQYNRVDPGNTRLRQLVHQTIDSEAWKLLWLPPSLPYYQMGKPFNHPDLNNFTKRLVFSAWHVVPKAVSSLISYEAERQIMKLFDENAINTADERIKRRGLLRFARGEKGRLTGMPILGIMYPSIVLAKMGDPLRYFNSRSSNTLLDIPTLLHLIQDEIASKLKTLNLPITNQGIVDESWYWAAPILLDRQEYQATHNQWWHTSNLASLWSGEEEHTEDDSTAWDEHLSEAKTMALEARMLDSLGRPPSDLSFVLAQMALGGLGNIALRALSRGSIKEEPFTHIHTRIEAAKAAWALRGLFNAPESMALIRGLFEQGKKPFWQLVLSYSINGCLQSVIDEYAHVLHESVGVGHDEDDSGETAVVEVMTSTIQLRTASLKIDDYQLNHKKDDLEASSFRMRAHFALRFGDIQNDSDQHLARKGAVREAFNSPFWPFVLVSTSVGQEGLDFHQYCHAIVHWNLPANPVDLEQREGRVHRYKGHAIRKNVAFDFGNQLDLNNFRDPWKSMFSSAYSANTSDLIPFWIYPESGEAKAFIERYVPILPLSRDTQRLLTLRKALTVYRMVFGQNRQEDLVNYLINRIPESEIDALMNDLQINLQPEEKD